MKYKISKADALAVLNLGKGQNVSNPCLISQ